MCIFSRSALIRLILLVFVVLLLLVGMRVWWQSGLGRPRSIASKSLTSIHRDVGHPLPVTEFQNTSADVKYVGNQVCGSCHAEQFANYQATSHSQAFCKAREVNEPPDSSFQHQASGKYYDVFRRDGQMWHRESLRSESGGIVVLAEYPMKYVVGSGQLARTYLVEDAGFLVESPITWYASLNAWQMSPGFDHPQTLGFQRTIDERCLFCHSGRTTSIGRERDEVLYEEEAISCERCHGPGSLHVERKKDAQPRTSEVDFSIVHPARLPREENESICAQCHLESASFVDVGGHEWAQFRPGYPLRYFVAHYRPESSDDHAKVVGHVEQLRQSRCYQESANLTCITCHKPHQRSLTPSQKIEWHRNQCLSCHSETSNQKVCGLDRGKRIQQSATDNCVQCHMVRSPTEAPHVATTHHRIGFHNQDPHLNRALMNASQLVPVEDLSYLSDTDRARSLGLANIVFAETEEGNPFRKVYLERARSLLEKVHSSGFSDSVVLSAIAQLKLGDGDLGGANRFAQLALRDADSLNHAVRSNTESNLAKIYFQRRDFAAAQRLLENVVQQRRVADDWSLLGACRQENGDISGAISAIERAVQISPDDAVLTLVLAELSRLTKDAKRYEYYRERARLLKLSLRAPHRITAPTIP